MLTLPAPATLNGDALTAELAAAGITAEVNLLDGDLLISAPESKRAAVQKVVDAHAPTPVEPQPSLADRLAVVEARLDKAAAATVTGEAAKLRDGLRPVT